MAVVEQAVIRARAQATTKSRAPWRRGSGRTGRRASGRHVGDLGSRCGGLAAVRRRPGRAPRWGRRPWYPGRSSTRVPPRSTFTDWFRPPEEGPRAVRRPARGRRALVGFVRLRLSACGLRSWSPPSPSGGQVTPSRWMVSFALSTVPLGGPDRVVGQEHLALGGAQGRLVGVDHGLAGAVGLVGGQLRLRVLVVASGRGSRVLRGGERLLSVREGDAVRRDASRRWTRRRGPRSGSLPWRRRPERADSCGEGCARHGCSFGEGVVGQVGRVDSAGP